MSSSGHNSRPGSGHGHPHGHSIPSPPWRQTQNGHSHSHSHSRPGSGTSSSAMLSPSSNNLNHSHSHGHGPNRPVPLALGPIRATANGHPKNLQPSSSTSSEYCETVVSMLSMLSCSNQAAAQRALLTMTNSPESCQALRKANCIPLLIQILYPYPNSASAPAPEDHSDSPSPETKARAFRALKNVVQFNLDEKSRKRESRILTLLEHLRAYSEYLRNSNSDIASVNAADEMKHPIQSSQKLMQLSFDTEQKGTMCLLGAVYAIAELITMDHAIHGIPDSCPTSTTTNTNLQQQQQLKQCTDCLTIRLYSGMTLTNLTVGDGANKALLCSRTEFLRALVAQLDFQNPDPADTKLEDRVENFWQVTASVLRNLSWRATASSQSNLRNSYAVPKLMLTAIRAQKESTLRAALSALWNLSAYCTANKEAICTTPGAIPFLIDLLTSSQTSNAANGSSSSTGNLIVENAGGILRNVFGVLLSSGSGTGSGNFPSIIDKLIPILLSHLKSSSLTIVANSCGILAHLSSFGSGSCSENPTATAAQRKLITLGAISKLKTLVYSKHEQISKGASIAVQNLIAANSAISSASPVAHATASAEPLDLTKNTATASEVPENFEDSGDSAEIEKPLDLSCHSSKSTPIHKVSAAEFGTNLPKFLNPAPGSSGNFRNNNWNSSNSCPEFMLFSSGKKAAPISAAAAAVTEAEDSTTNYSLHFTESEPPPHNTKNSEVPEEDTLKTYYCEGTPLNFSTANSMSDLTSIGATIGKLDSIAESENQNSAAAAPASFCAADAEADERPKNYCTESTPANFSRASSLSSIDEDHLESNNFQGGEMKAEYFDEATSAAAAAASSSLSLPPKVPKPKRNVTFSANETPLMFSRASSVNSLDSVDVELGYGDAADGASVVSEFSRRASEVVSPSELPDSPRQICPPESILEISHGHTQQQQQQRHDDGEDDIDMIKIFAKSGESAAVSGMHSVRSLSPLIVDGEAVGTIHIPSDSTNCNSTTTAPVPHNSKNSIQDETKIFHVEGTPFGVSTATSLSDLTGELEEDRIAEVEAAAEAPPLPPKKQPSTVSASVPSAAATSGSCDGDAEPIYTDAQILLKCINAGKNAAKLPKSHSENTNISGKVIIKSSSSCHEDFTKTQTKNPTNADAKAPILNLDPDLAALIQTGKNSRSLSSSTSSSKTKLKPLPAPRKIAQQNACTNSEISELEIPSVSISTAFKIAKAKISGSLNVSGFDSNSKEQINAKNSTASAAAPEAMENSMISVDSLRTEMADLTISTTTTAQSQSQSQSLQLSESTDLEASFSLIEEDESPILLSKAPPPLAIDRFSTYTKRTAAATTTCSAGGSANSSPRQKRREDPSRYLTRTIGPAPPRAPALDPNGNSPPPPTFSTFRSGGNTPSPKSSRIISARKSHPETSQTQSNESSPSQSPKGIRGRRKPLYSSLPAQHKRNNATSSPPAIPPKPSIYVRSTRTSELRTAKSRDTSRENSPKSSNCSLNSNSACGSSSAPPVNLAPVPQKSSSKKTPPKPPVRSTTPQQASVYTHTHGPVRTSNSSIGFLNDDAGSPISALNTNHTLPRCVAHHSPNPVQAQQEQKKKESKFAHFLNYIKGARPAAPEPKQREPSKFSFNFGRRKSSPATHAPAQATDPTSHPQNQNIWVKRTSGRGYTRARAEEKTVATVSVAPFNYSASHPPIEQTSQTQTHEKIPTNKSKSDCSKVTTTV